MSKRRNSYTERQKKEFATCLARLELEREGGLWLKDTPGAFLPYHNVIRIESRIVEESSDDTN